MDSNIDRERLNEASQRQYPNAGKNQPIFWPLEFPHLNVKNRLFRSNLSGMFDAYDGTGGWPRINWEESFAEGGVGAIISSFTPVMRTGRIHVQYAMIDSDETIPFWRRVGERVHAHDCRFLLQLSHSGRQQDIGGFENRMRTPASSTDNADFFHGILCHAASDDEIWTIINAFGAGARRAREAGLDGVELHGANGYLITQFLSSAINNRTDKWGGSLENRARFLIEIIRAIRRDAGDEFHLQLKTNAWDYNDALYPWRRRGNTLEDAIKICKLSRDEGVDALHISSGSLFPHPRNPPGDFSHRAAVSYYDRMANAGVRARLNYKVFRNRLFGPLFSWWWNLRRGIPYDKISEGINLADATTIKREVSLPVVVTGGFQDAAVIRSAIASGQVHAVSIARPLIANRDLPKLFAAGLDWSDQERIEKENGTWPLASKHRCSYCNLCLLNDLENPLGCYDLNRFDSYDEMVEQVNRVFQRDPWRNPEIFSPPTPG